VPDLFYERPLKIENRFQRALSFFLICILFFLRYNLVMASIRLSQTVTCAGCAAKLPANLLREILSSLPVAHDENVVVGAELLDDAGVYRHAGSCLVQTVDFFPPIIDDPEVFGRVAACNALSDVYAMGGRPLTALNILGVPFDLEAGVVAAILRGANAAVSEARASIVGGHSIRSLELFFGLSVTGIVDERTLLTNAGARDGDALVLTKPLGSGIITTARKEDIIAEADCGEAIQAMSTLNARASECAVSLRAHAATDISGFGFLGHAMQMARASKADFFIDADALPIFAGARALAERGIRTGAAAKNMEYVRQSVAFSEQLPAAFIDLLIDPQTSGGLLIALAERDARALVRTIGPPAAIVGRVRFGGGIIYVRSGN
jgi:selenide,water dikinase